MRSSEEIPSETTDRAAFMEALQLFFRSSIEEDGSDDLRIAKEKYRFSRFSVGQRYSQYITQDQFDIKGKKVLDVASAWGGHALAFADAGAHVVASDIKDHRFSNLKKFSAMQSLQLSCLCADCECLPFFDSTFDIILALDLIEHIDSVSKFANEVKRILKPGGICVVTTPPRLRSLIQGEPHWGLRGITLMPLVWQAAVARKVFGHDYPYRIARQYLTDSRALAPFRSIGLEGTSLIKGRLLQCLQQRPVLLFIAKKIFWDFLLVRKPCSKDFP